jgi:hypothetical protein
LPLTAEFSAMQYPVLDNTHLLLINLLSLSQYRQSQQLTRHFAKFDEDVVISALLIILLFVINLIERILNSKNSQIPNVVRKANRPHTSQL